MRPEPAASAAAPGIAQDARSRPVTNHTAPVDAGSCAAVERAGCETSIGCKAVRRASVRKPSPGAHVQPSSLPSTSRAVPRPTPASRGWPGLPARAAREASEATRIEINLDRIRL